MNDDLEAQLKIALDALAFYANPENYGQGESFSELSRISDCDLEYKSGNRGYDTIGGKRARRALLEIFDKDLRLRAKKIKKAALWNKTDDQGKDFYSVRVEFSDSTKEWIQLFKNDSGGDPDAAEFAMIENDESDFLK
jgi:hypothetical protein